MAKTGRRSFLKKAAMTTAGAIAAPYILPTGRLFAATGSRRANHVVFVLFAGGIRNQESVGQQYLTAQGIGSTGNIMENMLTGARPSSNLVYTPWDPILTNSLASQGTLYNNLRYQFGPTGHYNGHTVAMTGAYTQTGLNLNVNPEFPTVFEYYRKHNSPSKSALNAWWLSEGLGPYPSLNFSRDPDYGALYGANYLRPATIFSQLAANYYGNASFFQPDDVDRLDKVRNFLNQNFDNQVTDLPGIINTREEKEQIKEFMLGVINGTDPVEFPLPAGAPGSSLTGDLINIAAAWKVLDRFSPELMVVNTFNLDICHSDFSLYIDYLHKADYGVGWLWNKIQSHPVLANDTVMICMPEHGRNLQPNSLQDGNGLFAYDHTGDDNSRELFALINGPSSVIKQGEVVGNSGPEGEAIDIVPTIADVLGFYDSIPAGKLSGQPLTKAFL